MMNNGILFFGASVTAQSNGNGFFDYLAPLLNERGLLVEKKAFGSCHLDDAGFYAVHEINFTRYRYCFLDWNTTGLPEFSPAKLSYILSSMLRQHCIPVIMILPQERNLHADRPAERQMIELSQHARIPMLDLREGFGGGDLLRDHVHTTPAGARQYAERILKFIVEQLIENTYDSEVTLSATLDTLPSIEFRFTTDATTRTVEEGQRLVIHYSDATPATEILFDMVVGPTSPIVGIEINEQPFKSISIWDQWCHYERNFQRVIVPQRTLSATPQKGVVTIRVSTTRPDYETCRLKGFAFDGIRKLQLKRVQATNLDFHITID
jgi:hypothetical protein